MTTNQNGCSDIGKQQPDASCLSNARQPASFASHPQVEPRPPVDSVPDLALSTEADPASGPEPPAYTSATSLPADSEHLGASQSDTSPASANLVLIHQRFVRLVNIHPVFGTLTVTPNWQGPRPFVIAEYYGCHQPPVPADVSDAADGDDVGRDGGERGPEQQSSDAGGRPGWGCCWHQ